MDITPMATGGVHTQRESESSEHNRKQTYYHTDDGVHGIHHQSVLPIIMEIDEFWMSKFTMLYIRIQGETLATFKIGPSGNGATHTFKSSPNRF